MVDACFREIECSFGSMLTQVDVEDCRSQKQAKVDDHSYAKPVQWEVQLNKCGLAAMSIDHRVNV